MDASIKRFNLHSSQTFESLEFLYQQHKPGLISLVFLVLWITTAIVSVCVQRFNYSDMIQVKKILEICS